jgi:hypothetical protein
VVAVEVRRWWSWQAAVVKVGIIGSGGAVQKNFEVVAGWQEREKREKGNRRFPNPYMFMSKFEVAAGWQEREKREKGNRWFPNPYMLIG